ncbi:tenascin-n [Plakobranchus ocellatus]|uniref:Tenascin-n n=1 Tax=Plakobranchus ocellatus TaxID=259542 RepID=A0AAV4DYV8_9GAST|nr:tenascin-n [Plakobranchus ocellatus]
MAATKVILFALQMMTVQAQSPNTLYRKQAVCNLRDRINNDCFTLERETTKIGCAAECSAKSACRQFVFSSQDSSCYHQSACSYAPSCSDFDAGLTLYTSEAQASTRLRQVTTPQQETVKSDQTTLAEQVCENGGTFIGSVCNCSGTGGKVGQYCESNAKSCSDLLGFGYTNGDHLVMLHPNGDGSNTFETYCTLDLPSRSARLHLARSSGSYDTSYSFNTYKYGFYLGEKDFWLGLDKMIALTSTPQTLVFKVYYNSSELQGYVYIGYKNVTFYIDSAGAYRANQPSLAYYKGLDIKPTPVNYLELLPNSQVIDFFNSPYFLSSGPGGPTNCGNIAKRGWWYTTCGITNPMGWSYKALPGSTTSSHLLLPGVNITRVKEAFDYFSLVIVEQQ